MATNAAGDIVIDEHFYGSPTGHYGEPRGNGLATGRFDQELDPEVAFGRNGWRPRAGYVEPSGSEVALADDGSVVIAGAQEVRRLLPDGEPDERFGPDGRRSFDAGDGFLLADMAPRGDGALLLAGSLPAEGNGRRGVVIALTADGERDAAFGDGGVAPAPRYVSELHLLGDGRIFVEAHHEVARLEADGDADTEFGQGGSVVLGEEAWTAAPSGDGFIAARTAEGGGIEVQRRLENGAPDPDWGEGGTTMVPLDARPPDPETGDEVEYVPSAVLVRAGGGAVVGATRREGVEEQAPEVVGMPLLFDGSGDFEREGDRVERMSQLESLPDGGFASYSAGDANPFGPGNGSIVVLAAYDAAGAKLVERRLFPFLIAPAMTITSGPTTSPGAVTGPGAQFAVEVTGAPEDEGDFGFRCSLNGDAEAPCPAGLRFDALPEGPAIVRIRALGINGAASEAREYAWTVNHKAPGITVTAAPPATTEATGARIEFTADEPVTFACAVDGAAAAPCTAGALDLSGLALGAHEVAIHATDRFGAQAAPAVVRWTVVAPAPAGPAPPVTQPQPPLLPGPPVVIAEPRQVEILKVGKLRRGRVRVRILAPATAKLRIALSARIGGRPRRLGARVVKGRAGVPRTWGVKLSKRGTRLVNRAARRSRRVRIRAVATPVADAARR